MTVQGFNQDYYLGVKLAQLQSTSPEWVGKTTTDLQNYLAKAGLTPAMHYEMYGYKEGLAPNSSYNEAEYKLAKATQMFNAGQAASIDAALADFNAKWPGNAYEHYVQYGFKENVNASNSFDESLYLDSKLAALKADPATSAAWANKTVADLKTAFGSMTALSHYEWYGKAEGLKPIPVPAGEAVIVVTPTTTFTLTNDTDVATANVFNAGLVYTPGGNDRINSLQDEDMLTGTGTNPTLNATLGNANDNGANIITPTLNGIETLNVAFTGSGGGAVTALDLQDASGFKEVNITRVSQAVNSAEVGNIMDATVANMSIADSNANQNGTVEFSFAAGVLKGANTGNIEVSNVNLLNVNIGENTSGINARGVATNGYENLTLNSSGTSNTIGNLNMPMDTGTAGKLTITGDKALTIATTTAIVSPGTANAEAAVRGGGVVTTNGRLATIDASALTEALTLNISAGLLSTGKADTSGVNQDVTIIGTAKNDTFYLNDLVQAGDKIDGGAGTDTLVAYQGGVLGTVSGVENLDIQLYGTTAAAGSGSVVMDMAKFADTTAINVRNISAPAVVPAVVPITAGDPGSDQVATLNNINATQAANLSAQHSTTGNNGITDTRITANYANSTGASDLLSLTIKEGINIDPRFNLTMDAGGVVGGTALGAVENITITDSDTESNTVALVRAPFHTGTLTLKGGLAGTFINLDTTTAGANGGMYQYDVTGAADLNSSNAGATVGRIADQSLTANQVKITAGTIDASAEASDVVIRVSQSATAVSAVGAQKITMGSGNDTVIFDNTPAAPAAEDTRAGLTISDTVVGGAGTDTLVIDGNVTANTIRLGASEWTNVTGFENLRLVNAGAGSNYNLTITNNLLAANKDANGYLNIINDNDLFNNTSRSVAQAATATVTNADGTIVAVANDAGAAESAVTIDAISLAAGSKFSYKGDEGASRTADRIIMADANIDGNAIIDGGAIDNINNNSGIASVDGVTVVGNAINANKGNADVIEVRNAAVVSQGDLANVKNIGTLSFTNDKAVTQVSTLQLNDSIVDALVDSYQTSASRALAATQTVGGANVEVLQVNAIDNMNVAAATTGLTIEAGGLTDKSDLDITLGRGANVVTLGAGQDRVVLLGNYVAGTYAAGVVENGVTINSQSTAGAVARAVTDNINMGTGRDTLVTYGAINLVGATLTGVEAITANSALVLTTSQWAAMIANRAALSLTGPVITFNGNSTHQLSFVDDTAGADNIDLSLISLAGGGLIYDLNAGTTGAGTGGTTATVGSIVADTSTTGDAVAGAVGTTPTNNVTLTSAFVNLTAGGTFTGTAGTNDIFLGTIASLSGTTVTGTLADTEVLRLSDAGIVNINNGTTGGIVTNIDKVELFNGSNTISFTAGSGIKDLLGGTGNDAITVTNMATGGAISLGAGDDTLTAMTVAIATTAAATFDGGAGSADALNFAAAQTITAASLAQFTGFETVNFGAIGGASAVTLVNGITAITADTTGAAITASMTGAQGTALDAITNTNGTGAFNLTFTDASTSVNMTSGGLTIGGAGDVDVLTFTGNNNTLIIDSVNLAKITGTVVAAGTGDSLNLTNTCTIATPKFDAFETLASAGTGINITDSGVGVARTITGDSGNNTINVAGVSAAKTINISSGGIDTIQVSHDATAVVTVTGFTAGAGGDVIDLLTAADGALAVTTTAGIVATGGTATFATTNPTNAYVLSGATFQISGALTQTTDAGEVEAKIMAAAMIDTGALAGDFAIYALDNGTDTGIYQVTHVGAADGTLNAAAEMSVRLIGVLSGVADAGTLVAANIA